MPESSNSLLRTRQQHPYGRDSISDMPARCTTVLLSLGIFRTSTSVVSIYYSNFSIGDRTGWKFNCKQLDPNIFHKLQPVRVRETLCCRSQERLLPRPVSVCRGVALCRGLQMVIKPHSCRNEIRSLENTGPNAKRICEGTL